MLDQNLIALPDVLGPLQQLDRHSRQNDLFISRGPTKTNFALEHAGKDKKIISACPEKNSNPFPSWILVGSIAAPYSSPCSGVSRERRWLRVKNPALSQHAATV